MVSFSVEYTPAFHILKPVGRGKGVDRLGAQWVEQEIFGLHLDQLQTHSMAHGVTTLIRRKKGH